MWNEVLVWLLGLFALPGWNIDGLVESIWWQSWTAPIRTSKSAAELLLTWTFFVCFLRTMALSIMYCDHNLLLIEINQILNLKDMGTSIHQPACHDHCRSKSQEHLIEVKVSYCSLYTVYPTESSMKMMMRFGLVWVFVLKRTNSTCLDLKFEWVWCNWLSRMDMVLVRVLMRWGLRLSEMISKHMYIWFYFGLMWSLMRWWRDLIWSVTGLIWCGWRLKLLDFSWPRFQFTPQIYLVNSDGCQTR